MKLALRRSEQLNGVKSVQLFLSFLSLIEIYDCNSWRIRRDMFIDSNPPPSTIPAPCYGGKGGNPLPLCKLI